MPIYQSMNMVFGIVCGLIILGESDRYSAGSLVGISFSMILITAGILVLGFKKTSIANKEEEKGED